jgi:hypothetical protein
MKLDVIISVVMILSGAFFILRSILITGKLKEDVPKEVVKKWKLITLLMILFFVGYLTFILILLLKIPIPLEIFSGLIFFGGGFFVFLIINLIKNTLHTIIDLETDLWLSKERLVKRTDELTK